MDNFERWGANNIASGFTNCPRHNALADLSSRKDFLSDDQNAGEKTLILQASNPAVSATLFESSQAQKLQNQSVYAEVVCR
jgi:hypothetical protein